MSRTKQNILTTLIFVGFRDTVKTPKKTTCIIFISEIKINTYELLMKLWNKKRPTLLTICQIATSCHTKVLKKQSILH